MLVAILLNEEYEGSDVLGVFAGHVEFRKKKPLACLVARDAMELADTSACKKPDSLAQVIQIWDPDEQERLFILRRQSEDFNKTMKGWEPGWEMG